MGQKRQKPSNLCFWHQKIWYSWMIIHHHPPKYGVCLIIFVGFRLSQCYKVLTKFADLELNSVCCFCYLLILLMAQMVKHFFKIWSSNMDRKKICLDRTGSWLRGLWICSIVSHWRQPPQWLEFFVNILCKCDIQRCVVVRVIAIPSPRY